MHMIVYNMHRTIHMTTRGNWFLIWPHYFCFLYSIFISERIFMELMPFLIDLPDFNRFELISFQIFIFLWKFLDRHFLVFGGCGGESYLNSAERFDPREGNKCVHVKKMQESRHWPEAAEHKGLIYVTGGIDRDVSDIVEMFAFLDLII